MELDKIFLEEMDNLIRGKFITEMDIESYGKLKNKTSDYPWVKYFGNPELASKYKNINKLADDLFTKAFNKKYNDVKIKNGNDLFTFQGIRFNTNYMNYHLIFKNSDDYHIFIKKDNKSYYVDKYNFEDNFDQESQKIILDMLKYNN